jgi:hypothetical protein
MARNSKPQPIETKAPDFIAWHVAQKGDKAFWNKVGACWRHKDDKGMTLQLEVVPINGRIVLRQPIDPVPSEGRA